MIFGKAQLEEFLKKLDDELDDPAVVHVIGGAAATLLYDSKEGTKDFDTWSEEAKLQAAYERMVKKYPHLRLPFGPAKVNIRSQAMLSRFIEYDRLRLEKLKIMGPQPEDLFLLKAQRADEKDIDDLRELYKRVDLHPAKVLRQFQSDILAMNPGSDRQLIENYLFCVDKVFGMKVAKSHEKKLGL